MQGLNPLPNPLGCLKKARTGCLIFLVLTIVPPILIPLLWYKNDLTYSRFHIMSHTPLTGIQKILDRVDGNLKKSSLNDPKETFEALISDNHFEFSLFAPFSREAFGSTYKLVNISFITQSDVAHDLVVSSANENNRHSLTGILTEEFVKQMFHHTSKHFTNPHRWKIEGYGDYLAQESSFDSTKGIAWIRSGIRDDADKSPPAYFYFVNRMLVAYELDVKHLTIDSLMNDPRKHEEVLAEYRKSLGPP